MNPTSLNEAKKIFTNIRRIASKTSKVQTIICPPFVYLNDLQKLVTGPRCVLGSQNIFWQFQGAYTGEISPAMISDLDIKYVILGHSKRRELGETNEEINQKVKLCFKYNLIPIVCVGENKRSGSIKYFDFIKKQLIESLQGISKNQIKKIVVTYEPIWAIGKEAEREATPEEATEMSIFIRKVLSDIFDLKSISQLQVLYGGSVDCQNAEGFLNQQGINGLLLGRVSLISDKFNEVLKIAQNL